MKHDVQIIETLRPGYWASEFQARCSCGDYSSRTIYRDDHERWKAAHEKAARPPEPEAEIVEIRPGRHTTVEFVVRCTCGFESRPIWYRDIAEGRKRGHEIIHTREGQ